MKKIAVILILIFSLKTTAQYNGGAGDGFAYDATAQTTLTNTDLSVAYNGGAGDGFSFSSITQTTLNNTDLSVAYNGGAGDGFAFSNISQTTLNNTDLSILYQGGAGDGFATFISDPIVLDDFPRIKLAIQIILQGAALNPNAGETNLMRDDLRANNYLPIVSPYGDGISCQDAVFNTGGPSGTGLIRDNIVDWVLIELRNSADNTMIEASKSALLQRDGDVVDIDGTSPLVIPYTPGNYYLVVKHRNHLGVMTASSFAMSQLVSSVNFRNNALNTYGSYSQVLIGSTNLGLWAGNANSDSGITFSGAQNDANTLKDTVLADPLNILNLMTFSSNGYFDGDIDLDGSVRFSGALNDSNIIKDNVLFHPGNILELATFNIIQQLPNN